MMHENSNLKKPLLYALIISVIFGALLGIVLVLRGNWGWVEVRVMLTTVIIAVASVFGLACDVAKTPVGSNRLPKSGLILTAITAVLLLAGLWCEFESEIFWKTSIAILCFGVATVHVSLLSIAKLSGRFGWVYMIGAQVVFGLAILVSSIVVFEIDSEALWRFLAVHSILVAAITLIIPILHRISKSGGQRGDLLMPVDERNLASIDREIAKLKRQITNLNQVRATITGEHSVPDPETVTHQ